jgi:hypothetical protein
MCRDKVLELSSQVLKSTGLGISEFIIRFIAWLCLRNDALKGSGIVIFTGPKIEISIDIINRVRSLILQRANVVLPYSKQTISEINGVTVEAFPSNHNAAARGLANVSLVLLEERATFSGWAQFVSFPPHAA